MMTAVLTAAAITIGLGCLGNGMSAGKADVRGNSDLAVDKFLTGLALLVLALASAFFAGRWSL